MAVERGGPVRSRRVARLVRCPSTPALLPIEVAVRHHMTLHRGMLVGSVITCLRPAGAARVTPRTARVSASDPPPVNSIS